MITSAKIENLRGIRSGSLEDLNALTILTGPNGCGKSTILDALLIAVSQTPEDALGRTVQRHPATPDGIRWLVGRKPASIEVKAGSLFHRCQWRSESGPRNRKLQFIAMGEILRQVIFASDNSYVIGQIPDKGIGSLPPFDGARIVEPAVRRPLHTTYSEAVREGRKDEALALLVDLVPGLKGLEILTEEDGTPALYVVTSKKAIPASLAGDGVQGFLQLALELAASPGGLVLVEEPEVFQHPRAIRQSAKALLAAVRRDVQVVISTHSLEVIDSILDEATEDDLERIVLFNLLLTDGELKSSRFPGPEIAFARGTLENDLR